ncbi:hypothetical protein ACTJKC_02005 [Pedobacter sp. 22226]|uniref:hypothetical protein n=1 Tax=Pedobacter sp. 22226 TaxID=3453894 RepID=UPI003F830B20
MKIIIGFLFLILPVLTFAQSGKLYKGTINHKIKITFYLEGLSEGTNADPVTGSYRYDKGKGYILLNGHKNNVGDLSLVEMSSVNFTGTFLGTLKKNKITGRWISANQKEDYTFELTEVVAAQAQLSGFRNAIIDKASEFRSY